MKYVLPVLLLCLSTSLQAASYSWQDSSGKIHFGDNPPAGVDARPVDPAPGNVMPAPDAPAEPSSQTGAPVVETTPSATEPATGAMPAQRYTRLAISHPANGQTIRTDTGAITVRVDLQPALQSAAGHRLVAVAGGTRIQGSGNSIAIRAGRGSHQLQVAVIDASGKTVARSGQISFDVRSNKRLPMSRELSEIQGIQPAH